MDDTVFSLVMDPIFFYPYKSSVSAAASWRGRIEGGLNEKLTLMTLSSEFCSKHPPTQSANTLKSWVSTRELQRDVVYLGWPIAPSYMSPNAGGAVELRGLSQWVQLCTGAQINFGDLTSYLTFGFHLPYLSSLIPLHVYILYSTYRSRVHYSHRFNLELELQSLFWLHVQCTDVLSGWDPATPPPPHLGSYTRALFASQDRRHLFVTPWF